MIPPLTKILEAIRAELAVSIDARECPVVMERIERRIAALSPAPAIRSWRNLVYGALGWGGQGMNEKLTREAKDLLRWLDHRRYPHSADVVRQMAEYIVQLECANKRLTGRIAVLEREPISVEPISVEPNDHLRTCPCHYTTPCSPTCPCVNPFSSAPCFRCAGYGSVEQKREAAEIIAGKLAEPKWRWASYEEWVDSLYPSVYTSQYGAWAAARELKELKQSTVEKGNKS